MFNWLLSIDIMGGTSAPEGMPIKDYSITIEPHHVLIVFTIIAGLLVLHKFISDYKKRNKSNKEDDTKSDE